MAITPMPPYFYIRINKEQQKDRKEKIGSLYIPPDYVYMKRNMQCGEILAIGSKAREYFPQAKVCDVLIMHHIVENHEKSFFIDSDENFNYYMVQGFEVPGERNVTYGVWNGTEIIPNKDYMFLEVEKIESDLSDLEVQSNLAGEGSWKVNIPMMVSKGGLFIPKEIKKSREELTEAMKKNMERIKQLSNNKHRMTSDVISEIHKLEAENVSISKQINKKEEIPQKIAFINPDMKELVMEMFKVDLNIGDVIYILNIACQTHVEFLGKEYIVAENKYLGAPEKWILNSVKSFQKAI